MEVTVIIPNYNGKHFLKDCLESLKKQTYSKFHILVVDNASTDESVPYLKENYPEVEILPQAKNYGFSHAVNRGIRHSRSPYVLLLNNDTVAQPNFVEELVCAIRKDPRLFSVSSKMLQLHNPTLLDSAGDLYTLLGWAICRGTGRPASLYSKPDQVFSACAGAAIYRRASFDLIGFFDESHFAYLEDVDIGYRAKLYGYRNGYQPTAKVYHVGSGTSGAKYNAFKVKLSARNSIWLPYKNMPALQFFFNTPCLILGCWIKFLFFRKIGFGDDYRKGIQEGLATRAHCKKVPFSVKRLPCYLAIQWELFHNTLSYGKDWILRKLFHR